METLELKIAELRVHQYESWLKEQLEAAECIDCRELLERGIGAYEWLSRSEETIREGVYQGLIQFADVSESVNSLYAAWLRASEDAQERIARQLAEGRRPDNLDKFRQCCELVRDRIDRQDWLNRTGESRARRLAAEPW